MVLARVGNVKSGWKSVFMVFTTAASDGQPVVVRLAFETVEVCARCVWLCAGVCAVCAVCAQATACRCRHAGRSSAHGHLHMHAHTALTRTHAHIRTARTHTRTHGTQRIVRDHFDHITETEATAFTDCVNCLVAFTNNPHSLDVSLNAIAFLRFCAMKLADGAIGAPAVVL